MTDERPALGEVREMNWPDEMDDEDRVVSVVTTAPEPRSAEWIAERAGVDGSTTRSILLDSDEVESVNCEYRIDPEKRHQRQQNKIAQKSEQELRELQREIQAELDGEDTMEIHRRRQREYLLEMIDGVM